MSLSESEALDLGSTLHEVAFYPDRWPEALLRVAHASGGSTAQLIGLSLTTGPIFEFDSGVDPEVRRGFRDHGGYDSRKNLRFGIVRRPASPRTYVDGDYFQVDAFRRSSLFQDVYAPGGCHYAAQASLCAEADFRAVVAVLKSQEQGEFTVAEREALSALTHGLAGAVTLQARLEREGAAVTSAAFEGADLCANFCDRHGRVLALTQRADEKLSQGALLRTDDRRLRATNAMSDAALQSALRRAAGENVGLVDARSVPVLLRSSDQQPPEWVDVVSLPTSAFAFGLGAAAMVLVRSIAARNKADTPVAASRLRLAFGLTEAESRVALGISEGSDLRSLAFDRHVSPETVRHQLKSIFAKTGVSSRTELAVSCRRLLGE